MYSSQARGRWSGVDFLIESRVEGLFPAKILSVRRCIPPPLKHLVYWTLNNGGRVFSSSLTQLCRLYEECFQAIPGICCGGEFVELMQ